MSKRLAENSPSKLPRKRLGEFLVGMANTKAEEGDVQAWERFIRSFRGFFPYHHPGEEYPELLARFRELLQSAWSEQDREKRDWAIHVLRDYGAIVSGNPEREEGYLEREPPPRDGLQQALLYLGRSAGLARKCAYEKCDQDRFFLASQPNQQYCTDVCSIAAQRERKRGWWSLHGNEWRGKRKHHR
jgi:hypothetical protein